MPAAPDQRPSGGGADASPPAYRPLVLVVDDEDDIRSFLITFLTEEGYDVAEAADGLEALDAVTRLPPDAIVLDLLMPRMDGGQFLERYRALPGPRAPVIMASASSKYLGVPLPQADAHADKPFDVEQLLSLLARFTAR